MARRPNTRRYSDKARAWPARARSNPNDDRPIPERRESIPAPWRALAVWVRSGTRLEAPPGEEAPLTEVESLELVADHPELASPVVLASDMQLASWGDVDEGDVQARLCPDPGCGIEGCLPGHWVSALRDGRDVVIGPAVAWDPADEFDRREYSPPAWMVEHGPVLIADDRWAGLASTLRVRAGGTRDGDPVISLPSAEQLRRGPTA